MAAEITANGRHTASIRLPLTNVKAMFTQRVIQGLYLWNPTFSSFSALFYSPPHPQQLTFVANLEYYIRNHT